jgi:regulator of sirC expression with transglutaminase-like and TPR domain
MAKPSSGRPGSALVGDQVSDENIDLVRAALTIACSEYPDLDIEAYVAHIDELARKAEALISDVGDALETISALNHTLFDEAGLRGNRDYYDPRNSFLNDVLDRGLGIPLTLALINYGGGRASRFPFVRRRHAGAFSAQALRPRWPRNLGRLLNGGDILSPPGFRAASRRNLPCQMALRPEFLFAVSRRQILARILNNLENCSSLYPLPAISARLLPLVDLVLVIYPRSPEDVKQRALLRYSLGLASGAAEDLEQYLKMSPDASDADEIRETTLSIRRMLVLMN